MAIPSFADVSVQSAGNSRTAAGSYAQDSAVDLQGVDDNQGYCHEKFWDTPHFMNKVAFTMFMRRACASSQVL